MTCQTFSDAFITPASAAVFNPFHRLGLCHEPQTATGSPPHARPPQHSKTRRERAPGALSDRGVFSARLIRPLEIDPEGFFPLTAGV